jgi:nucleoside-diphosphate-sugar epimerase
MSDDQGMTSLPIGLRRLASGQGFRQPEPVNLGSGREISTRDLAEKIAALTGFQGDIR